MEKNVLCISQKPVCKECLGMFFYSRVKERNLTVVPYLFVMLLTIRKCSCTILKWNSVMLLYPCYPVPGDHGHPNCRALAESCQNIQ